MPTFIVKTPVKHDGRVYQPKERIELDSKAARSLHAVGSIMTQDEMDARQAEVEAAAQESGVVAEKDAQIEALKAELARAQAGGEQAKGNKSRGNQTVDPEVPVDPNVDPNAPTT